MTHIEALKSVNWVQRASGLSVEPVLAELTSLRRSMGISDFKLEANDLKTLVSEIKRQLSSDKVTESHKKYNSSLADHLKNYNSNNKGFPTLNSILIEIGNYHADTRRRLTLLQDGSLSTANWQSLGQKRWRKS